jgi:hypothetical protein
MRRILSLALIFCFGVAAAKRGPVLKEGDILFQFISCGPLCDAIVATTPCAKDHPFNHCGILVKDGDSLLVLEAIGKDVHTTSLPAFLKRDTGSMAFVGRLKRSTPGELRANLDRARALAGRPYDVVYLPGDSALYCSELVYESYYRDGKKLFGPEPMSFRSADGETYSGWTNYYRELGQEIPEGLPGTNPCALSRDPAVSLIQVEKRRLLK